jgi:hypothetical protein
MKASCRLFSSWFLEDPNRISDAHVAAALFLRDARKNKIGWRALFPVDAKEDARDVRDPYAFDACLASVVAAANPNQVSRSLLPDVDFEVAEAPTTPLQSVIGDYPRLAALIARPVDNALSEVLGLLVPDKLTADEKANEAAELARLCRPLVMWACWQHAADHKHPSLTEIGAYSARIEESASWLLGLRPVAQMEATFSSLVEQANTVLRWLETNDWRHVGPHWDPGLDHVGHDLRGRDWIKAQRVGKFETRIFLASIFGRIWRDYTERFPHRRNRMVGICCQIMWALIVHLSGHTDPKNFADAEAALEFIESSRQLQSLNQQYRSLSRSAQRSARTLRDEIDELSEAHKELPSGLAGWEGSLEIARKYQERKKKKTDDGEIELESRDAAIIAHCLNRAPDLSSVARSIEWDLPHDKRQKLLSGDLSMLKSEEAAAISKAATNEHVIALAKARRLDPRVLVVGLVAHSVRCYREAKHISRAVFGDDPPAKTTLPPRDVTNNAPDTNNASVKTSMIWRTLGLDRCLGSRLAPMSNPSTPDTERMITAWPSDLHFPSDVRRQYEDLLSQGLPCPEIGRKLNLSGPFAALLALEYGSEDAATAQE